MDKKAVFELENIALEVRKDVVRMVGLSRAPSLGSSLSVVDILVFLYFSVLSTRADDHKWQDRDRFILSKSNACPALYAVLARKGFFDREELWSYRRLGAMLQGTLDPRRTPGVEAPGGDLGLGLGIANGIALGCRLSGNHSRVYCLLGDGELNEGMLWESILAASRYGLGNLYAIVEMNGTQMGKRIEKAETPESLGSKLKAFGWNVFHADGHRYEQMSAAFSSMHENASGPSVLLCRTQWGKGVSHDVSTGEGTFAPLDRERVERALVELEESRKTIEGESRDDR